jgi:hypothetical protein
LADGDFSGRRVTYANFALGNAQISQVSRLGLNAFGSIEADQANVRLQVVE